MPKYLGTQRHTPLNTAAVVKDGTTQEGGLQTETCSDDSGMQAWQMELGAGQGSARPYTLSIVCEYSRQLVTVIILL